MGRLNIESVQLLLIPKAGCSLAEQTLTLRHTLSKLGMLTAQERETVSTAMLRYTQSLGSPENPILLQSILDELTETEQEGLLSLVESAMQLLEKQDLKKSTTPYRGVGSLSAYQLDELSKALSSLNNPQQNSQNKYHTNKELRDMFNKKYGVDC